MKFATLKNFVKILPLLRNRRNYIKSATLKNFAKILPLLRNRSIEYAPNNPELFDILQRYKDIDRFRTLFFGHDQKSVEIFDWRMQLHFCHQFFKEFPELENAPIAKAEWAKFEEQAKAIDMGIKGDYLLDRIDTWILESYRLKGICEVLPGDIVLSCGAYTGNTGLYFSQKTGKNGKIYCFEPDSNNFQTLKENLKHCDNVFPWEYAVTDKKKVLNFTECEGSGWVSQAGTVKVNAISLDEFCKEQQISHVDFIKMDIEGLEAEALAGAKEIINSYKPKMALSAYHKPFDMINLPSDIEAICPNQYTFYLRHFSAIDYETVLFCEPAQKNWSVEDFEEPEVSSDELMQVITFLNTLTMAMQSAFAKKLADMQG